MQPTDMAATSKARQNGPQEGWNPRLSSEGWLALIKIHRGFGLRYGTPDVVTGNEVTLE